MGGNKFGHQKAYGGQDNDHQCDPEVFGEHEDQCSDDRYDSGEKLGKSKQHTIGQNICICDNTADDISGTVSVKVRGEVPECVGWLWHGYPLLSGRSCSY